MSKNRKTFLASLDLYDWFFIVVAFMAIGYGLYRAIDLGPDSWGNVAGPLFSLASGFLFVVALRMQLREHRNALEEMEQNNTNHADLLLVAKQEKEFNVCLVAIDEARRHLDSFQSETFRGADALRSIANQWLDNFDDNALNSWNLWKLQQNLRGPVYRVGVLLPHGDEIKALRVKLYWVLDAALDDSPYRKELDERDAKFIRAVVMPIIGQVSQAIIGIGTLSIVLNELLAADSKRLNDLGLDRQGVLMCKDVVDQILKAATDRGYNSAVVI